jgi:hypothetical protein
VIPHKDNEHARHDPATAFDKETYRQRHVVEQCVGWLKEYRRIGTRFEKLAVNFHGMLQLAMIRRYLSYCFQTQPSSGPACPAIDFTSASGASLTNSAIAATR